jgi:quercetin dioxygenase-like cupin family protein
MSDSGGAPGSVPSRTQLPAAEAVELSKLVDYAAGSIVSRTLVENEHGTITLFAFDEGQALSAHTAPFDAVVHVLDGRVELTIGGKAIEAGAGQMVLMPANVPHAVKATSRFKMLLTMLRLRSSR